MKGGYYPCAYCPWPSIAMIELPQGFWRWLFNRPVRQRHVCERHFRSRGVQHPKYM